MNQLEHNERMELVLRRFQDGSLSLKETIGKIWGITRRPREIPVAQWPQYHPWPTVPAPRAYIFDAKLHDFEDCVVRRNGRVFIDEEAFFKWMERRKQKDEN